MSGEEGPRGTDWKRKCASVSVLVSGCVLVSPSRLDRTMRPADRHPTMKPSVRFRISYPLNFVMRGTVLPRLLFSRWDCLEEDGGTGDRWSVACSTYAEEICLLWVFLRRFTQYVSG